MKKKTGIIVGGVVVALLAIVGIVLAIVFGMKGKGYRSIKVYKVNGTVTLDRTGTGSMDAYENLLLQAEDVLKVGSVSYSCLLMDEDKYALVEEDTQLTIEASGKGEDTRTNVVVNKGGVCFDIQKKLNENSSFEVTTSNAVMAVRGTAFRVQTGLDEKAKPITRVSVVRGAVSVKNLSTGEEIILQAGEEAVVCTDEEQNKEVIRVTSPIDYSVMPEYSVDFFENGGEALGTEAENNGEENEVGTGEETNPVEPERKVASVAEYIAAQYDYAGPFHEGYAVVGRKDGENMKYFYINTSGEVISGEYDWAGCFSEGMAAVGYIVEGTEYPTYYNYGYIDTTGREVVPLTYKSSLAPAPFYKGYAAISEEIQGKYNEEWGYSPIYEMSYLIDKSGNRMPYVQTVDLGKGDDYPSGSRVLSLRDDLNAENTWNDVQNARIGLADFPVGVTNSEEGRVYIIGEDLQVIRTMEVKDGYLSRLYDEDFNTIGYYYDTEDQTCFLNLSYETELTFDYPGVRQVAEKLYKVTVENECILLDESGQEVLRTNGNVNVYESYLVVTKTLDDFYEPAVTICDMSGNPLSESYYGIRPIGQTYSNSSKVDGFKGFICTKDTGYIACYAVLDTQLNEVFSVMCRSINNLSYYENDKNIPTDYYYIEDGETQEDYVRYIADGKGKFLFELPPMGYYAQSLFDRVVATTVSQYTWSDGSTGSGALVYSMDGKVLKELPGSDGVYALGEIDGKKVAYSCRYENGDYTYDGFLVEENGIVPVYVNVDAKSWSYDSPEAPDEAGKILAQNGENLIRQAQDGTVILFVDNQKIENAEALSLPYAGAYLSATEYVGEWEWSMEAQQYTLRRVEDGSAISQTYKYMGVLSEEKMSFCNSDGKWGYLKVELE